jgi:PAS domain S-box-containing protein
VLNAIPTLAWAARSDGSALFFNQRWLDYTGLTTERARNWGWVVALHPDESDRLVDYWRSVVRSGEPIEIEGRLRRFDGVYRWFLFRATPSLDDDGRVVEWFGTSTDIEDRKRAEDALRVSERNLRLVINGIPGLVFTATAEGEIEFVNQQILDYTGRTLEELRHWQVTDLVHPDDLPEVIEELQRSIETEQSRGVEHRVKGADGTYRWFEVRRLPERNKEGRFARWYLLLADIHDRKLAEEALHASERGLRLIFETIPGFVWTMTAAGDIELVSQQMLEYFGRTVEELKQWSRFVHPDDRMRVIEYWRRTIETGEPYDVEHRLGRADGVYRWFHGRGRPLRDANDCIVRWYNLLTDVEERKQAEEKLRRSEWNLLEAQRLGHSGSWSLDVKSGIVSNSPEGIRLFAPGPNEDSSKPEFYFGRIHPDERSRVRDLFERCLAEKTDYQADFRILLPDGTIRHHHTIGHPILNGTGELVDVIGTGIDTTEHMEGRIALEKAYEEIRHLTDRLRDENVLLRQQIDQVFMFEEIVGSSAPLRNVLANIVQVAPTDATVLISGDTGTGKELIARAIHKRSQRSGGPFVSVNCASIPPSLIASELFGHEKGAFTGAVQRRQGRFELANSGTIFLDEVGELPQETQIALLRVIQERTFERVGGSRVISTDVRIIAATNRDLTAAVDAGAFRADLFYRLNVFPIHVPSLKDRKDDIPLLIDYFVRRYADKAGKRISKIDKHTLELCASYDWPGNIRELQNIVERSVILCNGETFRVEQAWLTAHGVNLRAERRGLTDALQTYEKRLIEAALAESNGKVAGRRGAAAKLGIPRSTLDARIKQLDIRRHTVR